MAQRTAASTAPVKLYLIAGESSGDVLGEELIKALRSKTAADISGVCGPHMRKQQVHTFLPMEKFQVMGFLDILFSLPKFFKLFYKVKKDILRTNPSCVVFIDYPGFNLRMARALRQAGYKGRLVHYVCPSVWAWGKSRIKKMADNLDLLLSILPFEKEIFSHTPLAVQYIGHPLVHKIHNHHFDASWSLPSEKKILSIFPGSRNSEILRNFPLQIKAAASLFQNGNFAIAVSVAQRTLYETMKHISKQLGLEEGKHIFFVGPEKSYELMKKTHLAIATSGTITLELALLRVPTVITYALKKFDQFLAQHIFRIELPFYTLPNIILGKEVFSELIGPYFTLDSLKKCLASLLEENRRNLCLQDCQKISEKLLSENSSLEAAKAILAI
ncbi:MAG: hypothetical protein Tsb0015_04220 [Simkaniaceae bacterium]